MPQPFASFRRRRGILRGANDGGYPPLRRESFGDTSCKAPPERGGARLWRAEGFVSPCRMVAAALSAAVTTTKQQEPAPNSQAESTPKNRASQTPAALREGARGRGFSQRSRLPRNTPPSLHKLMVNGADGGLEVFVVYADDDGKLAGALINHANVDAGAGH